MSHFYFHMWTGEEYETDDTGLDLPNAEEAYLEAFQCAWEISVDMLRRRRSAIRYRFDVVDSQGRLVHAIPFSEAMGARASERPSSTFVLNASRGYDLAVDLMREIATVQQRLQTCRELLAVSPTLKKDGSGASSALVYRMVPKSGTRGA